MYRIPTLAIFIASFPALAHADDCEISTSTSLMAVAAQHHSGVLESLPQSAWAGDFTRADAVGYAIQYAQGIGLGADEESEAALVEFVESVAELQDQDFDLEELGYSPELAAHLEEALELPGATGQDGDFGCEWVVELAEAAQVLDEQAHQDFAGEELAIALLATSVAVDSANFWANNPPPVRSSGDTADVVKADMEGAMTVGAFGGGAGGLLGVALSLSNPATAAVTILVGGASASVGAAVWSWEESTNDGGGGRDTNPGGTATDAEVETPEG